MLSGCGLTLGLDDYEVTDNNRPAASGGHDSSEASGGDGGDASGGRQSLGDGDGDGDLASGGNTALGGDSSGGRSSGGGEQAEECEDDQPDTAVDHGCDEESPICLNGECVECVIGSHCADDGQTCSVELCKAGRCERDFDDSACPRSDDPCIDSQCTPSGCVETDISSIFDLLEGKGSFESEAGWAVEEDVQFTTPPAGAAEGGNMVALMTNGANQYGNAYINLIIPEATISLTVQGYYRSFGAGMDHGDDFFRVGFWDAVSELWYGLAVDTLNDAASANVTSWTPFIRTIESDELMLDQNGAVEFNLMGTTDGGVLANTRNFAADEVQILARVCEP